jgi:hypothetical protein
MVQRNKIVRGEIQQLKALHKKLINLFNGSIDILVLAKACITLLSYVVASYESARLGVSPVGTTVKGSQ